MQPFFHSHCESVLNDIVNDNFSCRTPVSFSAPDGLNWDQTQLFGKRAVIKGEVENGWDKQVNHMAKPTQCCTARLDLSLPLNKVMPVKSLKSDSSQAVTKSVHLIFRMLHKNWTNPTGPFLVRWQFQTKVSTVLRPQFWQISKQKFLTLLKEDIQLSPPSFECEHFQTWFFE